MAQTPTDELLYNAFTSLFATVGVNPTTSQLERFRVECTKMVNILDKLAQKSSITIARKIQEAAIEGFTDAFDEIEKVKKKIEKLEKELTSLLT